jgi:hypothetical protein
MKHFSHLIHCTHLDWWPRYRVLALAERSVLRRVLEREWEVEWECEAECECECEAREEKEKMVAREARPALRVSSENRLLFEWMLSAPGLRCGPGVGFRCCCKGPLL